MGQKPTKRESNPLLRLDLDWQQQREAFLDFGREPRFPTLTDVAITSLFFLFTWGASVWLGHGDWVAGAAAVSIIALFSFRARGFHEAYSYYLGQRRRLGESWVA